MNYEEFYAAAIEKIRVLDEEVLNLKTAILDINKHASPVGVLDPKDPEGSPAYYAVTTGSLHRALGKVGHTSPKCDCMEKEKYYEERIRSAHLALQMVCRHPEFNACVCVVCGKDMSIKKEPNALVLEWMKNPCGLCPHYAAEHEHPEGRCTVKGCSCVTYKHQGSEEVLK